MSVSVGRRETAIGTVFNVQRFSLHDGPGIRTTVFLKGCPLHCPWCHNPESISPAPEVAVQRDRCLGCHACVEACPMEGGPLPAGAALGDGACVACRACTEACPSGARQVVGRDWTLDEVVAEVLRDRLFYDDSGGGVTFSGGEPLAQPDFLLACLDGCRSEGIHTAIDTSGFAPRKALLEAARLSDLVLFDLKLMDAASHRDRVGASVEPILGNLRALARLHARVWLRLPLIPGITDDRRRLEAAAELAAELGVVERICLLPYHRTGTGKLARLGRAGELDMPAQDIGQIEALAGAMAGHGVQVDIGG